MLWREGVLELRGFVFSLQSLSPRSSQTSLSVDESHSCKVQQVWLGGARSHRDGGES